LKVKLALKNTFILLFFQFFNRILGILKESIIIFKFGIGKNSDLAILGLNLPDLLFGLTFGDIIPTYIIPFLNKQDPENHFFFLKRSLLKFSLLAFAISALIFSFNKTIGSMVAYGLPQDDVTLLIKFSAFSVFFLVITSFYRSLINHEGSFFRYSLDGILTNTFFILLIYLSGFSFNFVYHIGVGLLSVTLIRALLSCALAVRKPTVFPVNQSDFIVSRGEVIFILHFIFFNLLFISVPIISRSFASSSGDGSYTLFTYAQRLADIPSSIGTAVSMAVLLPYFSKNNSISLKNILLLFFLLSIVTTVGLLFTFPISEINSNFIFKGDFSNKKTFWELIRLSMLAIPAKIMLSILTSYYFAKQKIKKVNILLAFTFSIFLIGCFCVPNKNLNYQMIPYVGFYFITLLSFIKVFSSEND